MATRSWLRATAAAMAAAVLFGCSGDAPVRRKAREPWRDKAEAACLKSGRVQMSAYVQPAKPISGPGPCGTRRPLRVSGASGGQVALAPAATLTCQMVPAVDAWAEAEVQPNAVAILGEPVTGLELAGSYSCRTRNNQRGARMSEHAYANGLDVRAFRLASGRRITVLEGWQGALDESLFLRSVHEGACRRFTTVIGPDGDRHHRDHLHLDLAWHGKDGLDVYCR